MGCFTPHCNRVQRWCIYTCRSAVLYRITSHLVGTLSMAWSRWCLPTHLGRTYRSFISYPPLGLKKERPGSKKVSAAVQIYLPTSGLIFSQSSVTSGNGVLPLLRTPRRRLLPKIPAEAQQTDLRTTALPACSIGPSSLGLAANGRGRLPELLWLRQATARGRPPPAPPPVRRA